jgi:hypothetical protein
MTAKSMKVERYARIKIPIMNDVYEVLEPAIAGIFGRVVAIEFRRSGPVLWLDW